jgi:Ribonuclease HII
MLENKYEKIYWENNQYVMGIDEVGRGPLCGPEVVASCILPINYENELITDSKKLSEAKREAAFKQIIVDAHYFEFKIIDNYQIDNSNIYAVTKKAMNELSLSSTLHSVTLTDAMPLNRYDVISIVKGDAKSISIAASSILAKVLRDHIMKGYDILYPEYEYNKHKGYATKLHLEKMQEFGLTHIYRMSYRPCKELAEIKLF